uniref:Uncharacterized protein LOC116955144 n=1 Tax=Petromyzon marinus TaxID=7757 RepID=A0AAJ7UAA5_PETMA|nr:uncharacterized protein LOC116955144 [Petromyzon marinus]
MVGGRIGCALLLYPRACAPRLHQPAGPARANRRRRRRPCPCCGRGRRTSRGSMDPGKDRGVKSSDVSDRIQQLLHDVNTNPVVVRWASSVLGRCVESHPLLAIFALLLLILSAPPVLLFLGAVAFYLALSTVGFILLQVCVLSLGVSVLLLFLSGLGALALGLTLAFAPILLVASLLLSRDSAGERRPPARLTDGGHGYSPSRNYARRNSLS